MKLRIIIIGLTFLLGTVISLRSIFNNPVNEHKELLLENIEALAQEENEAKEPICYGNGSVKCPQEGKTGDFVRYFSLRDKVSLY